VSRTSVIVLAGARGPVDPLARTAGVPGKVLIEIAGKPMLTRVMETIAGFDGGGQLIVVCPDHPDYAAAADVGLGYRRIDPEPGPARSVVAALDALDDASPALVVTGDHPLLEPAWLRTFIERARATGADAVVGLVDHALVTARFPDNRRTRYRFFDGAMCGTNLFYFAGVRGARAAELWRTFEADRKRPWKIILRLGLFNLLRYASGRLSVESAIDALSGKMQLRLSAVKLEHPEAAVDVDSAADLALVTRIIEARERGEP